MSLHVVALSGGKDSTAMALRLAEVEPREYTYICTPTGDELPEMFAHWRALGERLGKPIMPIMGGTLNSLVAKQNSIPNHRQRWCTRMLKIEPYAAWLIQASKVQEIVSYVGLRADEPEREGGDYMSIPGVTSRYPLREWGWGLRQVWQYLEAEGVAIPKRTDCARCFFQRIGEWWALWRDYPEIYRDAMEQEEAIGHTWRTPGHDSWPTSLADLGKAFASGRTPLHARQQDLFAEQQCRVCRL
jgi:3'-phosphoadenosine 5'-phosphosulfate sulfotransferase (PAPS reductase)/FAD synthetase